MMKWIKSLYLYVLLLGLFVFGCNTFANMLKMDPSVYTGKYFCPFDFDVKAVRTDYNYGTCDFSIRYDPSLVNITYKNHGSVWDQGKSSSGLIQYQGYNVIWGNLTKDTSFSSTQICATLTLSGGIQSRTDLNFVDKFGDAHVFANDINIDCPYSTGFYYVGGNVPSLNKTCNTLTGGQGMTIYYEACPCYTDNKVPVWELMDRSDGAGSSTLSGIEIIGKLMFTGLVNDRDTSHSWNYWFSGNSMDDPINNYKSAPSNVDNQVGVNSGTIVVTIRQDGLTDEVHRLNMNNLNVTPYTQGDKGNQITWNNNTRGYLISLENNTDYEVERPVTIRIEAYDNSISKAGSVCNKTSTGKVIQTYSFNARSNPIITFLTPSGSENVSPSTKFEIKLTDTWAGIDTGTFTLTFPTITGENDEILFTGFTINSGNLMGGTFTSVDGNPEDCSKGNACGYIFEVTLAGELPANTTMTITGYVKDLAGNPTTEPKNFTTMQSCKFFGCGNSTKINYVSGALEPITTTFTGSIIVLTGIVENNKGVDGLSYPRFEYIGDNCDLDTLEGCEEILMCSPLNTHPNLTGNIKVRNGSTEYTGSLDTTGLYITGLNWEYQSGVIIIN